MVRISEDLLSATEVVRGEVALRPNVPDARVILQQSLDTANSAIVKGGVQLSTHMPVTPVRIVADAGRLEQVFVNLLSNAARYTPPGGEISVALSAVDGMAIVRVGDTGDGIAAERMTTIFDPFVRSNDRPGGLGVGLAVARSIIEAHGGTIDARSEGVGKK